MSTLTMPGDARARPLTFAPDSSVLVVGTVVDNLVMVWDVTDPAEPDGLEGPDQPFGSWVNAVSFSVDGDVLAAGASDDTVRLYDTADWSEIGTLPHGGIVSGAEFADDDTLVTTADDGAVRVWTEPAEGFVTTPHTVFNVTTSGESGATVAVGPGFARSVSVPGGFLPAQEEPAILREDEITGAGGISSSGEHVALARDDGHIAVYGADLSDPSLEGRTRGDGPGVMTDLAWAPDSETLAAVGTASSSSSTPAMRLGPR
ncbi:hypothetical protein [Janibacter alkaliphilus]|uniref:WD40 repeat protein n=1 Tax=Janibacter alkaliphilus TaxID=1069963 RepID=A0A852XGF5_9MICO|nr:WD40 repeat protein [Janibacter alkaliphilus]